MGDLVELPVNEILLFGVIDLSAIWYNIGGKLDWYCDLLWSANNKTFDGDISLT